MHPHGPAAPGSSIPTGAGASPLGSLSPTPLWGRGGVPMPPMSPVCPGELCRAARTSRSTVCRQGLPQEHAGLQLVSRWQSPPAALQSSLGGTLGTSGVCWRPLGILQG